MTIDEKLDLLMQGMSEIKTEIRGVDKRMTEMDQRLTGEIRETNERMEAMEERLVKEMDQREDYIFREILKTNERITHIQLILENDIGRKLSILAEGYTDLVQKTNYLTAENKKWEADHTRLDYLEKDVRKIKEKLVMV